jgi:hypothetical protein
MSIIMWNLCAWQWILGRGINICYGNVTIMWKKSFSSRVFGLEFQNLYNLFWNAPVCQIFWFRLIISIKSIKIRRFIAWMNWYCWMSRRNWLVNVWILFTYFGRKWNRYRFCFGFIFIILWIVFLWQCRRRCILCGHSIHSVYKHQISRRILRWLTLWLDASRGGIWWMCEDGPFFCFLLLYCVCVCVYYWLNSFLRLIIVRVNYWRGQRNPPCHHKNPFLAKWNVFFFFHYPYFSLFLSLFRFVLLFFLLAFLLFSSSYIFIIICSSRFLKIISKTKTLGFHFKDE